MVCSI